MNDKQFRDDLRMLISCIQSDENTLGELKKMVVRGFVKLHPEFAPSEVEDGCEFDMPHHQ